ncbi:hypothetical protein, partial [Pseudomonas syringae group genomosp. 7]|uniref:hypothetical protein n=1 Tax=Pseudomonas syringae group genomosp. 7 TaxID=251699 RepID=UPI00376FAE47
LWFGGFCCGCVGFLVCGGGVGCCGCVGWVGWGGGVGCGLGCGYGVVCGGGLCFCWGGVAGGVVVRCSVLWGWIWAS